MHGAIRSDVLVAKHTSMMACLLFLCLVQGDVPPVEIALELYSILSESDTNLRQPVGLENQLMKNSLGSEVGQSILQLLQVHTSLLHFSMVLSM